MKSNVLVLELDHLEYELQAVTARCSGVKRRITDEWELKKPAGNLFGNSPIMMSKPLDEEMVLAMLTGLTKQIEDCFIFSKGVNSETGQTQ